MRLQLTIGPFLPLRSASSIDSSTNDSLEQTAWSSQRRWHSVEGEFIYLVEGEIVLVTDAGEEGLLAGGYAHRNGELYPDTKPATRHW